MRMKPSLISLLMEFLTIFLQYSRRHDHQMHHSLLTACAKVIESWVGHKGILSLRVRVIWKWSFAILLSGSLWGISVKALLVLQRSISPIFLLVRLCLSFFFYKTHDSDGSFILDLFFASIRRWSIEKMCHAIIHSVRYTYFGYGCNIFWFWEGFEAFLAWRLPVFVHRCDVAR